VEGGLGRQKPETEFLPKTRFLIPFPNSNWNNHFLGNALIDSREGSMKKPEVSGTTHKGGRENNEDRFGVYDESTPLFKPERGYLYCVADGMGGHRAGEMASQIAVQKMQEYYSELHTISDDSSIPELLQKLFIEANKKVIAQSESDNQYRNMGTTLTVAVVKDETLYYAHAGDSRLYILRKGQLKQLTDDHTITAELYRMGRISKEEITKHPHRNRLLSYLGMPEELTVQVGAFELAEDDRFLLCTDGLTDAVDDERLSELLSADSNAEAICQSLRETALENDATDNVTSVAGILSK